MTTDNVGKVLISIVTLIVFVGFAGYIFLRGVPSESHDIILQMEGALISWITTIISYWVGSSSGSAAKDKTISDQLPAIPPPKVAEVETTTKTVESAAKP